jgi:phosphoesterase RecJ-like protein
MGWNGHDRIAPFCVNIDHHRDNTRFADFNYVDQGAAATAMLLYRFFESRGISYPKSVAEYLYTAIMTDTGGFRFSNTSADVLAICADLARRGANSSFLYQRVYDSHSQNAMLLWARIWPTLRFDLDGRVCSLSLPLALVEELGAVYSDTEGMADYTVLAEDVEVGMFIKYRPTEAHFSLRSRGGVDVGRIAQKIPGGGGHGCAAGCTIALPYDQAKARMLETIKSELG